MFGCIESSVASLAFGTSDAEATMLSEGTSNVVATEQQQQFWFSAPGAGYCFNGSEDSALLE